MFNNLILLLLGGSFFVSIYITIQVLKHKSTISGENRFLGSLLIISSINLIHPHLSLITGSSETINNFQLSEPSQFLLIPGIYIYIRNHLQSKFSWSKYDLLHTIPFLISIIFIQSNWYIEFEQYTHYPLGSISLWIILVIQSIIYQIKSRHMLQDVTKKLEESVSNVDGFDLEWSRKIFYYLVILSISYMVMLILMIHFQAFSVIRVSITLLFTIITWKLGLKALNREIKIYKEEPTNSSSPIKESEAEELKNILLEEMESNRYYLNPNLTLNELSRILGYSRNEISWVLNSILGKNFYTFINEYRISHIISLMKDETYKDKTILDLALEGGFNSKPTFNQFFKKSKGTTPLQYRKSLPE